MRTDVIAPVQWVKGVYQQKGHGEDYKFFHCGLRIRGVKGGPGAAGASRIGYFTQHEPQMSPPWVLQLEARSPPTYLPTKIPFFEELPMNAE